MQFKIRFPEKMSSFRKEHEPGIFETRKEARQQIVEIKNDAHGRGIKGSTTRKTVARPATELEIEEVKTKRSR